MALLHDANFLATGNAIPLLRDEFASRMASTVKTFVDEIQARIFRAI